MHDDLESLLQFLGSFKVADSIAARRKNYDAAAKAWPLENGFVVEPWQGAAQESEIIRVPGALPNRRVLYLHGGGFSMGSPRSHRHLAAQIGKVCRTDIYVLDYHLAPEHAFPAAHDDMVEAYRMLAEVPGTQVAVVGDSAGGGLSIGCAIAARDAGMVAPIGVASISPWVDLSLERAFPYSDADPMMRMEENREYSNAYLQSADAADPRASPLFADLRGLPPILIKVGSLESIYLDSARLAQALRKSGCDVRLEVEEGAPHVWPWYWPKLEMGRQAIDRIGAFLDPLFE
jgi:phosphinothricin tripeptide acetyl hydrolase